MPFDCHPSRTPNLHLADNPFMDIECKVTNHTAKCKAAAV